MFDNRLFRPGGPVKPEEKDWPSFRGAINEAMREEMRRDPLVFQMGEDIALASPFGVTTGLAKEFGRERIRDAPCAEVAVVGAAVGAAMGGMRPIVEFQFGDFMSVAIDQLTHQAAMLRYLTGGQVSVPLVIRLPCGGGQGAGSQHSQSLYSWFAHVPGIKVLLPSTSMDAKAMMKAAIRDNNPVLFFEHKQLYRTRWPVPAEFRDADHVAELGKAAVRRAGVDITVVATLTMVHHALAAAEALAAEGVSVEVIDPRTLVPFDVDTLVASVRKTGRLLVVDEAYLNFGIQAEVIATVAERAFEALKAAPRRLGNPNVPVPFAPCLQDEVLPGRARIEAAIRQMMSR
ncbi:alpha-ketoacid dehydrogenase subunit beta [Bradyrhizobium sp.]|uniref:alpha-ketoacid dehydrogenase subunit beta n=1 Tax=Bradyrhizobium sp. TaxID=376 RepID=UPI00271F7365|nr:transketolase C-terminal domain-containing protein [Bradyrhizobium sp.]MDO9295064.1 transketolase C-terminal domain-containing protein [Bradyrhizobium sp.]